MAFDPSAVSGLAEHWDPDDITGSGGDDVSSWTGAVNSLVLSGPGGGDDPVLMGGSQQPSGKQAVLFGQTNNRLTVTDASLDNGTWTYIMVACHYDHLKSLSQSHWLLNKDNTNPATIALRRFDSSDQIGTRLDGSEGTFRSAVATGTLNTIQVRTLRYDGSDLILRINGVQVASVSVSGTTDTDNSGPLVIGNHPSSFRAARAIIGDIAVWDTSISDVDMASLESDLMDDWGITDGYGAAWTTGSRSDVFTPGTGEDEIFSVSLVDRGSGNIDAFAAIHESGGVWRWIKHWASTDSGATWDSGTNIIDANTDSSPECRGVGAVHDGSDYQILVDGGNGSLYHFTGSSLGSLTDNGSVYSGEGTGNLDFARHPAIDPVKSGGKWRVFFDGRDTSATSGIGAIGMVTTADFSTWDTATEIISSRDFWWAKTDVGAPAYQLIDGVDVLLFAGFNEDLPDVANPHWIGIAKSTDGGSTWTVGEYPILAGDLDDSSLSVDNPELFYDGTDRWLYFTSRDAGQDGDIMRVEVGSAFDSFVAAGSSVLSADPGTYSLSGTDASLLEQKEISVDPGSLSLSGTDANLLESKVISAEDGTYSIVGTDTNLLNGFVVSAELGSYSISGTDANLEHNEKVVAESGTYSLVGTDASLFVGSSLPADPGTYTLSGTNANLLESLSIVVDSGSYNLVGTEANLENNFVMTSEDGSYSLTGTDAELTVGNTISAESGVYSLTGEDASLIESQVITASPGTYTLTGTDATLIVSGEAIIGGQFVVGQVYIPGFKQGEVLN